MKHIKKITTAAIAVMLLAQTASVALGATTAELQAMLAQLTSQLASLQSQVQAQPQSTAYTFTRNLTVGSKGTDVKKLQEFLVAKGYLKIAQPTTYFGAQTKAALAKWQLANKISPAVGFFGTLTRGKINASSGTASTVTPSVSYISRPVAAAVGSSVAIKFASASPRKANIYLCKTKDDCNTVIAANVPTSAGDNTFTWAVPADVASGSYTIKIEDVANSNWAVYTDVPLTKPIATATVTPPVTQPVMAAFSLQQPASTMAGKLLTVKFTSKNAKNMSMFLCTDSEHCDIVVTSRFAITDGLNNYIWTVPTTITPREYFIKIKDADNANGGDFTSDLFTITANPLYIVTTPGVPAIAVATPASTMIGGALTVGFTPKNVKNVSIVLCSDNAHCDTTIISSYPVFADVSNEYSWTIPTATPVGSYFIKMKDANNVNSVEFKSAQFSITALPVIAPPAPLATIDITQPAAAKAGSAMAINFTTKGVSSVDMYLCITKTQCDATIKKGVAIVDGVNTYAWTIPATTTAGQYYIKITKAGSLDVYAFTKSTFAIAVAPGTVCRDIEGFSDLFTTCDVSEEAVSGSCIINLWPEVSVPAPEVTIFPTGMGAMCTTVPGTVRVKVRCCK